VLDQRKLLQNLFSVLNGLTLASAAFAAAMTLSALLLVATTVRLSAFSRRREIGIMRLVGASRWLIQLPFLLEALLATVLGAAIAVGVLLAGVHYGLTEFLSQKLLFIRFIGTADVLRVAPWLFLTGLAISVVASIATMRRYVRV
jgi:cell division transport system permease protein